MRPRWRRRGGCGGRGGAWGKSLRARQCGGEGDLLVVGRWSGRRRNGRGGRGRSVNDRGGGPSLSTVRQLRNVSIAVVLADRQRVVIPFEHERPGENTTVVVLQHWVARQRDTRLLSDDGKAVEVRTVVELGRFLLRHDAPESPVR